MINFNRFVASSDDRIGSRILHPGDTVGRKRTFEFQVRWKGFESCSDTHEPLESLYADVPTLIQDFVDKGTRLNSEQEKDLREAINALKVRGASRNEPNSTTTAVPLNRDDRRLGHKKSDRLLVHCDRLKLFSEITTPAAAREEI